MITLEKLKVYERYKGDGDMFVRLHGFTKRAVEPNNFFLISSLMQDSRLMQRGLASTEYAEQANKKLIENCDDEKTVAYLRCMAMNTNI